MLCLCVRAWLLSLHIVCMVCLCAYNSLQRGCLEVVGAELGVASINSEPIGDL